MSNGHSNLKEHWEIEIFSAEYTAAPKKIEILFIWKKGRIDTQKLAIFVSPIYWMPTEVRWKSLSHVQLFDSIDSVAHRAPLSMEFSNQEYWSG